MELFGMLLGISVMLLIVIFGAQIFLVFSGAKVATSDDKANEVVFSGKIIEKFEDNAGSKAFGVQVLIDRIVFEKEDGTRVQLRNVRPREIMLSVGDKGTVTVRGETIYAFARDMSKVD